MARQIRIYKFSHTYPERTSAFTSLKASVTLEAAMTFPLFLFAALCLIYLLEISAVRINIRAGMYEACKKYAEKAYLMPLADPSQIRSHIIDSVGKERVEISIIKGGSSGIRTEGSYAMPGSALLRCKVTYEILLPVVSFGRLSVACTEEIKVKGWTGYTGSGFLEQGEETVYITETGIVYHKDYHCAYLDLSIQMVPFEEAESLRNNNQEKYYPCERCIRGSGAGTSVYITGSGNRYHNSLNCSGLKRSIYAVPVSETGGRRPCSRCSN